MMEFIQELKNKNALLFYFGLANILLAFILFIVSKYNNTQVDGINAWYKPIKFGLSIGSYCLTIAWYMSYLQQNKEIKILSLIIFMMLLFEIIYISIQAYKGQYSHYNLSTPTYSLLYSFMAIAATTVSILTAYLAYKFFTYDFKDLPIYYIWSIRFGLILFVIFSLEGFLMGSNLSTTIGAGNNQGARLTFLGWSMEYGDLRVAHFFGMHALQIIPLVSYYLLKDLKSTIVIAIIYFILALYVLIQAIKAKPFISI